MHTLKIGVIGCGSIAKFRHLPEYASHPSAEIVAVCDTNQPRVAEAAKQYGAKAYTDYKELLKDNSIDVISICLPNYLHAEVSIAALFANKHVLCEKPMATNLVEAEQMLAVAKEKNRKLMVAQNQRFVASHRKARQLIKSGEMGKIYSFRTAFGHPGPESWSADGSDSWFFKKEEAFVGAMGDLGVHKIDLMHYLFGESITEVASFIETNAKENTDVDDNAVCIVKTASGIIGTLAASWAYNASQDNSTIIYAENAVLRLEDDPTYSLIVHYTNGEVAKYELGAIQTNEEGGQHNSYVVDTFLDAILNNKEVPVTGEDGTNSLKVVLAALQSHANKTIEKI